MFGFGKGKIELKLEKLNYHPGETIKGTLSLELKEPVQARELRVIFAGLKRTSRTNVSFGQGASVSSRSRSDFVHRFKMQVDGEKEYLGGSYPFEIAIPSDLLQKGPDSGLQTAMKAIQFLGGVSSSVQWFVEASLDIPGGMDVSKKVQINLT
jgi:hypothetical protein